MNITDETKKIIFVFRKKSFFQNDPIIASTIINSNEFPKSPNDQTNTELRTVNIYESIQKIKNFGYKYPYDSRRVFGQMQIQLSLTEAFPSESYINNGRNSKVKTHQSQKYGSISSNVSSSKTNNSNGNENQYQNDLFFV